MKKTKNKKGNENKIKNKKLKYIGEKKLILKFEN